jgi:hypothetical protein
MATLSVTRSYADGEVLVRADLDAFLDDIETFVNVTRLNDDNIQNSGITASTKLIAGSITADKIQNGAVTTAKIADDAVTAAKINSNVAGDGLSQNISGALDVNVDGVSVAVVTDIVQLKDGGITTAKILNANVTKAKLEALGQQTSSSSGSYTNSTGTETTVVSVNITTIGRPVMILLVSADTAATPTAGLAITTAGGGSERIAYIKTFRDSTIIQGLLFGGYTSSTVPLHYSSPGILVIDQPAAGTYTYALKGTGASGTTLNVTNLKLVAIEL